MSMYPYVTGYPPDGSTLGQTKSTVRNNLDGTFYTVAVDHVDNNGEPGDQPAGYHTIIHGVPQTSVYTVTGYNQVFSGVPGTLVVNTVTTPEIPSNGDTQLYSLSGMGALAQLTGFNAITDGYAWVGGILLQWGSGSFTNGQSVSFPVAFPTACLNVQVSANSSGILFPVGINGFSKTSFVFVTGSSSSYSITWIAIGN